MGTRLYPSTSDSSIMERLAGVAPGTQALLEQLEATWKETRSSDRDSDTLYDLLDAHPEANRLYDFHLFGWGKLNSEQWALIRSNAASEDDVYGGSTIDPRLMQQLVDLVYYNGHRVNLEGVTALSWG
jgi:hypothetical protein